MNAREFLALLLPSSGVIFTASPVNKAWRNMAHRSLDAAIAHVNRLTFEGEAAYFALATYEHEKYWDAAYKNTDGTLGKHRTRTQDNARSIQSFFLDLDVDPLDPKKFESKAAALSALKVFLLQVELPRPLLVDSGGGIHAYWPLAMPVSTSEWRPVAELFKAICLAERLRADMSVIADQARVLRCLGSYNVRRNAPVTLLGGFGNAITFDDFASRITGYAHLRGIAINSKPATPSHLTGAQAWGADDNLGATNDPAHFDRIVFTCAQVHQQVAQRGAGISEPLWRAGLGIAKFCEGTEAAARLLSGGHAEFDQAATQAKLDGWHTGPTTCANFHALNPSTCEACPHWQHLTSPIQLGKHIEAAPAPTVNVVQPSGATQSITLPEPPTGYTRGKDGSIRIATEDKDGRIDYVTVCPCDLYPISIDRQNGSDARVAERSWWRVHLPDGPGRTKIDDFEMASSLLANNRELFGFLLTRGIYMSDDQAKATGRYMSAYLRKMAQETGRAQLYERLGWQDERESFVLGDRVVYQDGRVLPHKLPPSIRSLTQDGLHEGGTLQGWQQAMQFYNRPGYEASRFMIYCALGAPLLHMTGTDARGALILATGQSGRGKSLALKACSSIWGHPSSLVINGNKVGSTSNALYSALGTIHSLPFLWDEITQRSGEELRDFLLNVSTGRGKMRLRSDGQMNEMVQTWDTITLASANTDVASLIASDGKDADAHQRRLFSVEFTLSDTSAQAKQLADQFLQSLARDFGHVGPRLITAVMQNYKLVEADCQKNLAMIDTRLAVSDAAAARYWTAVAAAAYTGAKVATSLGLIDFPVKQDLAWIIDAMRAQCEVVVETRYTALDILTNFLNANLRNTLTLSAKGSSNLDNVEKEPFDRLVIRNEVDNGVLYIEVGAVRQFFLDQGRAYAHDKGVLIAEGVIVDPAARRNIGSDTRWASNGQARCWKIDTSKLGGSVPTLESPTLPSNVTPLRSA